MAELSEDQIRDRAYFLWQQDGQPEGINDWHYWLLAEQQIRAELMPEPDVTADLVAAVEPAPTKPTPRRKAASAGGSPSPTKKAAKAASADPATAAEPAPAKKTPEQRRSPVKPGKA